MIKYSKFFRTYEIASAFKDGVELVQDFYFTVDTPVFDKNISQWEVVITECDDDDDDGIDDYIKSPSLPQNKNVVSKSYSTTLNDYESNFKRMTPRVANGDVKDNNDIEDVIHNDSNVDINDHTRILSDDYSCGSCLNCIYNSEQGCIERINQACMKNTQKY